MTPPLFTMKMNILTTTLIFLISIGSLLGQIEKKTQFTINQSGRAVKVVLSCDELYCQPANGSAAHRVAIPDQKNLGGTATRAKMMTATTNDRLNLVLYPEGREQTLESQLILQRKITVTMEAGASAKAIAKAAGAVEFETPDYAPGFVILSFENAGDSLLKVQEVSRLDGVKEAEVMVARSQRRRFTPNDPLYASYQWHLKNTGQVGGVAGADINIESVWDTYKGTGVTVGVIDDGFDLDHPDLVDNFNTALGRNWNDGDPNDPSSRSTEDNHGSPCAGLVGSKGNNGINGSGVAPEVTLAPMRLIGGGASSTDQDQAESAAWRNDVISIKSNSWGGFSTVGLLTPTGPLYRAALENSLLTGRGGLGTIHLRSSGNSGVEDDSNWEELNNSRHTISVGAIGTDGRRTDFSRPGSCILISAPGDLITTTDHQGGATFDFGGTSASCPIVAGVCALMLEANPGLGWRDVQEILARSARKVDSGDSRWVTNGAGFHFNYRYGAGMVDAEAAVALAENWVNLGPEQLVEMTKSNLDLMVPDKDPLIGQPERLRIPFTFDGSLVRVEHAIVSLEMEHLEWGQIELRLISPDGTSSLMSQSTSFTSGGWDLDWGFLSVHHWGELSQGTWYLELVDTVQGRQGIVENACLKLHGSSAPLNTATPVFTSASSMNGNVESYFEQILTTNHGAITFTATGLPSGLMIDEETGFISGYPDSEGSWDVMVTANNGAETISQTVTMTINARIPTPPTISVSDAFGIMGKDFQYQIETDYPVESYTSTALPAGLTLNTETGLITGIPTAAITLNILFTVTNPDGLDQDTVSFQIQPSEGEPLGIALDTSDHFFFTGGKSNWVVQSADTTTGGTALKAGALMPPELFEPSDRSLLWTFVEGPGVVSFDWRVSADSNDGLRFLIADPDAEELDSMRPTKRISGESDWIRESFYVPAGRQLLRWYYTEDGNILPPSGQETGWVDHFEFTPIPPRFDLTVADCLDYQGLDFEFKDASWLGQNLHTFDGVDAMRSPPILDRDTMFGDYAKTSMSTTVTGPGQFSFHWRLDAYDFGEFYGIVELDGTMVAQIDSFHDWSEVSIDVPAGTHEITWSYEKDGFGFVESEDALWIDQVRWAPTGSSGYEQWLGQSFTAAEMNAGEEVGQNDDFDGDSVSNLFEYRFGLDPRESDGANLVLSDYDESGFSLLVLPPSPESADALVVVEISTDLINWEVVPFSASLEGDRFRLRLDDLPQAAVLAARLKVSLIP